MTKHRSARPSTQERLIDWVRPLGHRAAAIGRRAVSAGRAAGESALVRQIVAALRRASAPVTWHGWAVIGLGAVSGFAGWALSWREFQVIAIACGLLLLLAVPYVVGRTAFDISIGVDPQRVRIGAAAEAVVEVRNITGRPVLRGVRLETQIRVGDDWSAPDQAPLPYLAAGAQAAHRFTVPTTRRGVVRVGPVRTVRADPLGLLRREGAGGTPAELFVHPATVPLDDLGPGLLPDLEGRATNDRSVSDVAFHSLREYVVGDDLRHVHALTSARLGKLTVRQFVETRSAHLVVVVSAGSGDYRDEDEFEAAVSAGSSVALRGVADNQRVSVLVAGEVVPARSRQSVRLILDGFSRAGYRAAGADLVSLARRAVRVGADASLVVLITGSRVPDETLWTAARRFGPDVRTLAIKIAGDAGPSIGRAGALRLISVPALVDLRPSVRAVVRT